MQMQSSGSNFLFSPQGYDNEERAYIATQGPLAHTLEDFWQLVLSRRAPAVVMITKLRENGRIKCAGYLPETRQKATFGKIEVTVKRILPRNGYTLRQVTVKVGSTLTKRTGDSWFLLRWVVR